MWFITILRAAAIVAISSMLMSTGVSAQADPCAAYLATPPVDDHAHEMDAGATPDGSLGVPATPEMATPGPAAELPGIDLAFIDLMTPHHEGAVVMAEIALARTERPEISALAGTIIDSQTAEQAQMQAWRSEWFPDAPTYDDATLMSAFDVVRAELGVPADGAMSGGHMDPGVDARALCAASDPFGLVFIDRMISHHQAAIEMAEVVLVAGERDEIKNLAQTMIDTQSAEIAQMQIWREQWFGATPVAVLGR